MFKKLFSKITNFFWGLLIAIYIILEELIWETIAEPVFAFIHSLALLQKAQQVIERSNRYIVLILFLSLFVQVEFLGIYALKLVGTGRVVAGTVVYAGKIPLAAFTFWLFRISKDQLLTFIWFKSVYDALIRTLEAIKASPIHKTLVAKMKTMKIWIKAQAIGVKQQIARLVKIG